MVNHTVQTLALCKACVHVCPNPDPEGLGKGLCHDHAQLGVLHPSLFLFLSGKFK